MDFTTQPAKCRAKKAFLAPWHNKKRLTVPRFRVREVEIVFLIRKLLMIRKFNGAPPKRMHK